MHTHAGRLCPPPHPGPVTPCPRRWPHNPPMSSRLPTMTKGRQNWTSRLGVAPSPLMCSEISLRCNGWALVGKKDSNQTEIRANMKVLRAPGKSAKRTSTAKFRKFHKFVTNPTSVVWLLKNDLIFAISQRESAPN